jgi:hypothetical protein
MEIFIGRHERDNGKSQPGYTAASPVYRSVVNLTTLSQLHRLRIVSDDLGLMCKEAVMAYFKVVSKAD